jgi:6-pyruvoyltetrahydropterin/6-carboxytetrahydropterin synthase
MELFQEFRFEAAHTLPRVPEGHKCRRMHGHSYLVTVHVGGSVDEHSGMVVDFADIDLCVRPIIDGELDHRYLNDVSGLENPTSEELARWLWARLAPRLPGLRRIGVRETATSGCVYDGSD